MLDNTDGNEPFKYWDKFIQIVSLVENLVRSDREGNWELHLHTVQELLPLFAAFASFAAFQSASDIYLAFVEGTFVVKRTHGHFKAVGADMTLDKPSTNPKRVPQGLLAVHERSSLLPSGN